MPVPPGLSPVANDAQATGDSGGFVVPSGSNVPDCARRARFGRCPCLAHLESRFGSAPSKPSTTTCVVTGRVVRRLQPTAGPARMTAAASAVNRRILVTRSFHHKDTYLSKLSALGLSTVDLPVASRSARTTG